MRRFAAAVTALLALLALAPAAAASTSAAAATGTTTATTTATGSTRPALAGVTTIRGSHTAVISVRLARPAVFYHYPRNSVRVWGKGKLAGLVLVQDEPNLDRINIVAGRFVGPHGAERFAHSAGDITVLNPMAPKWKLPAGNYRLYLVTDGKPVTVHLELGGLSGARSLFPTSRVPFDLKTPPIQRLPQGVYSAGADHFVPRLAMAFGILSTDHELLLHEQSQHCFYDGAPPEEGAYGPTCPDQASIGFTNLDYRPVQFGFTSSASPLPRGRYGVGFYNASVGLLKDASHAQFWMSFN